MSNETILIPYADGIKRNPNLTLTNVITYGNYDIGMCHLKITNFSIANDGFYDCSYFQSGKLHIQRFNVFIKSKWNMKV